MKYKKKERSSELHSALDVLQTLLQKSKGPFASEFQCMRLEKNWHRLVGKDLAKDTSPRKIYKSTLYISSTSSEAGFQFRFSKDILLERINAFLKPEVPIAHFNFNPPKEKTELTKKGKELLDQI